MQNSKMTTEGLVAGLRQIADYYEAHPDSILPYVTVMAFPETREQFLAEAKRLAAGAKIEKSLAPYKEEYFRITRTFGTVNIEVEIRQALLCRLLEPARPAVYDCPPLLEEIAGLEE